MTREIKFRAWNSSSMLMRYSDNDRSLCGFFLFNDSMEREGVKCELMQYTGLKDEYEKDIYQGDIVHFRRYNQKHDEIDEGNAVVEFGETVMNNQYTYGYCLDLSDCKQGKFKPSGFHRGLDCGSLTIIGNIYENPELLKKEKNV